MLQTEVLSARSGFCTPRIVLLDSIGVSLDVSSSKSSQSKHVWQQANNNKRDIEGEAGRNLFSESSRMYLGSAVQDFRTILIISTSVH